MGRLGKKSGRGFYSHKKHNEVYPRTKKSLTPDEDPMDRLILSLLNEAVACQREGIVSEGDLLDAGAVFGIGFAPFRGGPLHYIRTQGVDAIHCPAHNPPGTLWRTFAHRNPGGSVFGIPNK